MPITIAAIQMNSQADVVSNLEIAGQLIQVAVSKQASLIILPEMFAIVCGDANIKRAAAEKYDDGPIQAFLSSQAKQYGIWLVGGTIPILHPHSGKVNATCLLFNPQGKVAARYDKMHLFDVSLSVEEEYQESADIFPGDSVVVADTPFGRLGMAVCYDIRFPELFRSMMNQGAQIFVVPAAFTVPTGLAHWEVLIRSRAIENSCYVIGACQTGQHGPSRRTYGHSAIIGPWGEILAIKPDGVGVITAEVDLNHLQDIRRRMPVREHQRIFNTLA